MGLLVNGDYHPRHHVPGSGGAFFFATFILVLIGLVIVIACRRRDPWWRFILYGLAVAVVPGAISVEPFHAMRLMAYPVFLLVLTVPALEWLLARGELKSESGPAARGGGWRGSLRATRRPWSAGLPGRLAALDPPGTSRPFVGAYWRGSVPVSDGLSARWTQSLV